MTGQSIFSIGLTSFFIAVSWDQAERLVHSVCMLSRSVASDSSWPQDFSVLGIFQARILEQVDISYSKGSSQPRDQTRVSGISCICRWILTAEPSGKPLVHNKCSVYVEWMTVSNWQPVRTCDNWLIPVSPPYKVSGSWISGQQGEFPRAKTICGVNFWWFNCKCSSSRPTQSVSTA